MAEPPSDMFSFFGGSPIRLQTLRRLRTEPMTKTRLQEELETSRITLWRLLREFEDRGWIRETGDEFEVTAAGRIVVERTEAMQDALEAIEDLGELLEWLPVDEFDFPVGALRL